MQRAKREAIKTSRQKLSLNKVRERFKKISIKSKLSTIIIVLMLIVLAVATKLTYKKQNRLYNLDTELLRAINYEQLTEQDQNIEGTDNVKFSAFFLRDVDGDGYADKIKGTCKEVGKEDTLYMEIIVQTAGYLKDGKIEVDGKNFFMQTALPKDNELKANYIGSNITEIEFENLNNGTQKLITGVVKSGDYSYGSATRLAIGNNINNYSRNDNKIIFTGIYVDANGVTETEIRKEIPLTMDWYGTTKAEIYTSKDGYGKGAQSYEDLEERIDHANNTFRVDFLVRPAETANKLNLSKNYVEGTIPNLNGYEPISVVRTSGVGDFTYDEDTKKFTITRVAETDENGEITYSIAANQSDNIRVMYPLEAYEEIGNDTVTISVPVSTYFEGYNNPNTEFRNPYKSNTATATIVANYRNPRERMATFTITVGKYVSKPSGHYMISKSKPLRLYNGVSSEETNDTYEVVWHAYSGPEGDKNFELKETRDGELQVSDTFITSSNNHVSMDDVTTNVGIYFEKASYLLAPDGEIKVYDEDTGILLHTFTSSDWNRYYESNPYRYTTPVKHIRIVTSNTNPLEEMHIHHIKELDDEAIVENYSKEEFDSFERVESNLVAYYGDGYLGSDRDQAYYEAPYSLASISLGKSVLSTQTTEKNMNIFIETTADVYSNQVEWTNGNFLIKLPDEILSTKINSVSINNSSVSIDSYEYIENENGKFIKIKTSNINPTTYEITINAEITPDPRIPSTSKSVVLYATNEEGNSYYNSGTDTYDVDDDGNTEEKVLKTSKSISMIAPNSLLTNQTISDFDEEGNMVISPQIVDLKPIYGDDDREKQTVKIGAQMRNNYSSTISEIVIVGEIPFAGNSYVLSGNDLNSEYTTTMTSAGVSVPAELEGLVDVYYSENENPSKDISDENNGWMLKEDVTDWTRIKTWAVDFKDTVIRTGQECNFYYTVEIPFGVDYNEVSFSHHGIYFCFDTPEGKYRTQTEPNRVGVRIADKYNLILTKYLKDHEKLISGATYRVSKLDNDGNIEESQTAVTNQDGLLEMDNLYAERIYEIKEIQSPTDYEINNDVIKIIGHIDRADGTLTVEKLQGTTKEDLEVIKNEGEDYKVSAKVEDEAKAVLKLTKFAQGTETRIKGVRYSVKGYGLPTNGRKVTTNINGEIMLAGLKIGEEYTLEEMRAEGYYLADPVKFRVVNSGGTYEIQITSGTVKTSLVTTENDLPIAHIELEDEAIPRYNLVINKIEKGTGVGEVPVTPVVGAKFKLYKDNKEQGEYTTDSEGHFTINNLYQYSEEKNIDQSYRLKEVYAPEGFAKTQDIVFYVENRGGELEFVSEQNSTYTAEGNTISLTVEDSPSFKLIKKDGETSELLPNVKFAIYDVTDGEVPARNSKGEIIGTRETINGREYYTVTTNANGEITADLPEGLYKAVEVEAEPKYDIENKEAYFGIGASREDKIGYAPGFTTNFKSANSDTIYKIIETSDEGYLVGGQFSGNNFELDNGTILSSRGGFDGMVIKYNSDFDIEWAKAMGGSSSDYISAVLETSDGGYLVGGQFTGNIYVEEGVTYSIGGTYNGIVVKYSSEGEYEWSINTHGTVETLSETINNEYLIGGYHYSVSNTDLGNGIILGYHGGTDGLLLKTNSSGQITYANSIGENREDRIKSVIGTSDGGFLAAGYFVSDSLNFGNGVTIQNNGSTDGFVAKYNSAGIIEWAKAIGGTNTEVINSVIETKDGKYLVCGSFSSKTLVLDLNNELVNKTTGSRDYSDGMLIKYNSSGEIDKAISFGGSDIDTINSICETKDSSILAFGEFKSTIYLNANTSIYSRGDYDGLVVKFNSDLNLELAFTMAGNNYECIKSGIETVNDEIVVVGSISSRETDIGYRMYLYNNDQRTSGNTSDGFIVKYEKRYLPEITIKDEQYIETAGEDKVNFVVATYDGGYIVGGIVSTNLVLENGDIINGNYMIKYNAAGECEWSQNVSSTLKKMIRSKDEGYIMAYENGTIEKYDRGLNLEWTTKLYEEANLNLVSICETSDGGYLLGCENGSRPRIIKHKDR